MQAKANPKQPRAAARINSTLDKHLATYMTVAAAAGVGALALAPPAEAEIVYTPANAVLNMRNPTIVDFNNDGVADLTFYYLGIAYGSYLFAQPGNNKVMNAFTSSGLLPWGKRIGPAAYFAKRELFIDGANHHFGSCVSVGGKWINKKGYYLGVQFSIGSETHYGWVRLSVGKLCSGGQAVMTGYAYETVANKPIIAGKASGFAVADAGGHGLLPAPSQPPASLGMLALGADGMNIWRREEDEA